jgi:hypothetical protein
MQLRYSFSNPREPQNNNRDVAAALISDNLQPTIRSDLPQFANAMLITNNNPRTTQSISRSINEEELSASSEFRRKSIFLVNQSQNF